MVGAKVKVAEYEDTLDSIERGEAEERLSDATRKIAILRANEAVMIRRYQAVEESERMFRAESARLKEEVVTLENGIVEKLGHLQR